MIEEVIPQPNDPVPVFRNNFIGKYVWQHEYEGALADCVTQAEKDKFTHYVISKPTSIWAGRIRPRICIGIPQPEQVDYRFVNSLWNLMLENAPHFEISRTNAVGSTIAKNRCMLADAAKAWGATHMLQIDADQTFPSNALPRLLAHDLPIVCATASRRVEGDQRPVCEPVDLKSLTKGQKLVPMRLVGFPFMLIKMEVFEKLRRPWFADPPRWMMEPENQIADTIMAEDEYFCLSARRAGYDVMCDMELSMEIGHIGTKEYMIQNPK
jgi:hypothetical protein